MTVPGEKVVTGFFEGLKDQPALLALAVSNFALLAFIFYALTQAAAFRSNLINQNFEYQKTVTEILSKCIIPKTKAGDLPPAQKINE
jgi:hypothetical protein